MDSDKRRITNSDRAIAWATVGIGLLCTLIAFTLGYHVGYGDSHTDLPVTYYEGSPNP